MTQLKHAFTRITVDLRPDERAIVVIPRDEIASAVLERILEYAPDTLVANTGGMAINDAYDIIGAYLNCGGEAYQHTTHFEAGGSSTGTEYRNAIKVMLDLTEADKAAIEQLRSYFWHGMLIDPSSTIDNFRILPLTNTDGTTSVITKK